MGGFPGQTGWLWSYLLQGCRSPCTQPVCEQHSVEVQVSACVSGKWFLGPLPRGWATDPRCPLPGNTIAKTLTAFMVQLGHSYSFWNSTLSEKKNTTQGRQREGGGRQEVGAFAPNQRWVRETRVSRDMPTRVGTCSWVCVCGFHW